MWSAANRFLKRTFPSAHALLKRRFTEWMNASDPVIGVPKRVRGEFFWVHPRLLTTEAVDHEPHIYQWIRENLPREGVLFDVGANCGWISLNASRHVGPKGRVIAFEASPVLVTVLRYHQRRNRLAQMTVVDGAVSEWDDGTIEFYLLNDGLSSRNSLTIGRSNLPFLDADRKRSVRVATRRLDTFCEGTGLIPDVIKIDVEGAEGIVLRGTSRILQKYHPVVVVSIHPFWLPPQDSAAGILDFMESCGYRVKNSHRVQYEGQEIVDYLFSR